MAFVFLIRDLFRVVHIFNTLLPSRHTALKQRRFNTLIQRPDVESTCFNVVCLLGSFLKMFKLRRLNCFHVWAFAVGI